MKKLIAASMVLALFCSGCNQQAKTVSRETSAMAIKFNELVKAGKTTREQEQAYISAMGDVCYALDRALRGTNNADTTKRNATIEAKTGINPEGPVKINMEDFKDNEEIREKYQAVCDIVDAAAEDAHRRDMETEKLASK